MNSEARMPPCAMFSRPALTIYVAGSFRHKHGVRLPGRELRAPGCRMPDWTEKAAPPPGLMLHGAACLRVDDAEEALALVEQVLAHAGTGWTALDAEADGAVRRRHAAGVDG